MRRPCGRRRRLQVRLRLRILVCLALVEIEQGIEVARPDLRQGRRWRRLRLEERGRPACLLLQARLVRVRADRVGRQRREGRQRGILGCVRRRRGRLRAALAHRDDVVLRDAQIVLDLSAIVGASVEALVRILVGIVRHHAIRLDDALKGSRVRVPPHLEGRAAGGPAS